MCIFRRLLAAERGTIVIMAAFALTAVMGMTGLAVEAANGYSTKIRNQRVADMAALGAAQAYQANQSATVAAKVAQDIVAASGLSSNVNARVTVNAPVMINGTSAIQVTVTTSVPIRLAQVVMHDADSRYDVTAAAAVSLVANSAPACITALSGTVTYGVSITGGTTLTANGCAVLTNSGVSATAGTKITAAKVIAGKTVNDVAAQWNTPGITTTPTANNIKQNQTNSAIDTVGTDPRVIAGFAKVGDYTAPTAPGNGTKAWNFDYNHNGPVAAYWNSSSQTYTVPTGVTVNASSMTVAGGMTVTFQGSSIVTIAGGLSIGGGGKLAMGATTLDVGGQVNLSGGANMTVASGNVAIGNNGSGSAIYVDGGSTLRFGDGAFSANGSVVTSGGSNIVFGATASHYINGTLNLNGSSTFGAGAYYINGAFTNNTGGSMNGSGVTFFMAGSLTLAGGTSMNMVAPTTDDGGGITDLLFATKTASQTKLGGGSQNTYAGVVYAPNSDMVMDGGAGATGNGRCFMLVVGTFAMNGGAAAGTACTSLGSQPSTGSLNLLQ